MRTEYSNVKIPLNTVVGATVQALSNRNGTKLTRVTEHGRDDLVIERAGKPTVHLAWVQVKGGFMAEAKVLPIKPPTPGADEEEGDGEAVPVNDVVRVTKRKKAGE